MFPYLANMSEVRTSKHQAGYYVHVVCNFCSQAYCTTCMYRVLMLFGQHESTVYELIYEKQTTFA